MTEVLEQPGTLRRTGTAVLALAASELLGKVATFVMFLVMARLLAVTEFGVLSFGISLGLLLAVFSSLGLDARVVQLGSARPELLDRCYGALVAIRVVLAIAVLAVTTVVLLATMRGAHAVTVSLLVASCLIDTVNDASRAACGARRRQEFSAFVLVLQRFATLVLSAGVLVVTGSAIGAALGYLVATCVGAVAMHGAARRAGVRAQVRGSRPEVRMILDAAPVMGIGAVAAMGVFRIDAALVTILLGTTAAGVYGAGYRIFESVLFVSWTLSRAFAPVIASRPDDKEHVRLWARRGLVVAFVVYLPYGAVFALRGDDLVALLFGEAYVDHGVLLGLAAAPLLFGIMHLAASVLLALRPDPTVLTASLVALVVNVVTNLWLIPVWGLAAAAFATSFAFLLQAIVLMVALTKVAGNVVPYRPLLAVVVATVCAGFVAEVVDGVLVALLASVVVFFAALAAAMRVADPAALVGARGLVRGGYHPSVAEGRETRDAGAAC